MKTWCLLKIVTTDMNCHYHIGWNDLISIHINALVISNTMMMINPWFYRMSMVTAWTVIGDQLIHRAGSLTNKVISLITKATSNLFTRNSCPKDRSLHFITTKENNIPCKTSWASSKKTFKPRKLSWATMINRIRKIRRKGSNN